MIRSLWTAKTGLDAQQTNLDVIANNLANVSTNGYKKGRAIFEDRAAPRRDRRSRTRRRAARSPRPRTRRAAGEARRGRPRKNSAPPRPSPSARVSTRPVSGRRSWKALAVRTASWPVRCPVCALAIDSPCAVRPTLTATTVPGIGASIDPLATASAGSVKRGTSRRRAVMLGTRVPAGTPGRAALRHAPSSSPTSPRRPVR